MNILEFAKKKEQFSIDLYMDLARKTKDDGLKNIFAMLAEEERKHCKIVSDMVKEMPVAVLETPMLKNALMVFRKMKKRASHFVFPDSEMELYAKARQSEEESRQFYQEKAKEMTEPKQKRVFKKLADEEQKHFVLLDNICDFVSRPLHYLENAEFTHLENYMEDRSEARYPGNE